MPVFTMVSTGKRTLGGGLKVTDQVGYLPQSRHDVARLCMEIDAPDIGLETTSIPDVWAHLLKFHQTLASEGKDKEGKENNDLKQAFGFVQAQWRGLLAFVVLRREFGIENNLKLEPVFPESDGYRGRFLEIALRLLPDELMKVKVDWESVHAISYDGVTIGCTSPLTFVCPSAARPSERKSIEPLKIKGCKWFENGLFTDPVEHLEGHYIHCLREWIRPTIEAIGPQVSHEEAWDRYRTKIKAESLRAQLDLLDAELAKKLISRRGRTPARTEKINLDHDPHFTAAMPVQCALQQVPYASREITVDHVLESPFCLLPADRSKKNIVLIGQPLVKLPGFDGGSIEMLRGVTLNEALADYQPGQHNRLKNLNVESCSIYSSQELFCEKMIIAKADKDSSNAFPGAYTFSGVASLLKDSDGAHIVPILPLNKDFLGHFTSEYLIENAEFKGSHSEITVSLRVRLNGVKSGVTLSRTYSTATNTLIDNALLPEVRVWPEYSEEDLPGWKSWYTYYNDLSLGNAGSRLKIAPREEYQAAATTERRAISAIVDRADKSKGIELTECSKFPRIFECKLGNAHVGVLLAKPEVLRKGQNDSLVEIGIDFGTTGTSVFFTEGHGKPEILELDPHILALTAAGGTESYRFFLPTLKENEAGLLSVFKDFRGSVDNSNHVEPFTDGHISFPNRSKALSANEDLEAEGICADMKWGNTLERARGQAFLKQLCLLTALQVKTRGAINARWVFSYPLAFSGTRRENFRNIFSQCVDLAFSRSGLKPKDGISIRFRDESTCAGNYAKDVSQFNLGTGSLVLDIGGGSSDISVWQRVNLVPRPFYNTSVKFAGRDLLQRPLLKKPNLLFSLASTPESKQLAKAIAENKRLRNNETIFFSQVDSFFNLEGPKLQNTLALQGNDSEVKRFVGILQLGVQGLFFYAGLILRKLNSQGKFSDTLPNVFVCGNGGKILHWLSLGTFKGGSSAEFYLLKALLAGTGLPQTGKGEAKISLSKDPKTEAAYGMLVNPEIEPEDFQERELQVVAGEAYSLNGELRDPMSIVAFNDLGEHAFLVPAKPPMLAEFLKATGRKDLPPGILQDVVAETNDQLAAMALRRMKRTSGEVDEQREDEQPIFMIMLNELIRKAAADFAEEGAASWWM